MKVKFTLTCYLFLIIIPISKAAYGYFADCPAFITVGGTIYEVGNCSSTSFPAFHGASLSNVNNFSLTYGEIQTYENGGDNVMTGFLYYRIWTGMESGAFSQINLSTLNLLGGGNERRSASPNINLLNGLLPSTTYTLEIYFQAEVDWNITDGIKNDDIYHSNGGVNYELQFTTSAVLPVSLTKFGLDPQTLFVNLSWSTATELNNSHFDIQRSADSRHWETIGNVAGNGTTLEPQEYHFTDRNPLPGMNYYRLRQVDYDGNFEYSKVISIDFKNGGRPPAISPNPVSDELFLRLSEVAENTFSATIFDLNGRAWIQQTLTNNALNVSTLPEGIYFIKIENDTRRIILRERFIKN